MTKKKVDKPKPKAFKRKGEFAWNKTQTTLTCNGAPVARIDVDQDDLLDSTYYSIQYADKVVKPGHYGFAVKDKAINHITKRFNLQ